MFALPKISSYIAYDPGTFVCHFLNSITDSSLSQSKLSLEANCVKYGGNFDVTVKYLMAQVDHQQVNKQLNITSVGSNTRGRL